MDVHQLQIWLVCSDVIEKTLVDAVLYVEDFIAADAEVQDRGIVVDGEMGAGSFKALEEAVAEESNGVLVRIRDYLRLVRIVVRFVGALLEHLE